MKYFSLLVFCLFSHVLFAQNKELSPYPYLIYAKPVANVTIDGNLNDWPQQAVSYPIKNKLWGDDLVSKDDLSATFKLGYSLAENALYLALTIVDDEYIEDENPAWNNQDTYSFYINEQYKIDGSGVVRYTVADNLEDTTDPTLSWDPLLEEYISLENLESQILTEGNRKTIELKYVLKDPISVEQMIGFGHMINDKDQEGNTAFGWVGRGGKSSYSQPGRIGTIMFSDENPSIGTLTGKVIWKDTTINMIPGHVRVISTENEDQWVYLPVNKEGYFSAHLPLGKWVIHLGSNTFLRDTAYFRVPLNLTKTISITPDKASNYYEYILEFEPKPDLAHSGNLLYGMKEKSKKQIDQAIESYMDYYEIEGVSFAAWKEGKIIHQKAYGVKNNYSKEKVTPETLFEVASITKPTFAFIVMRLYEKGIIDLDEPLYKHLEFDQIKDHKYSKLVTARHVLSHQTGFPNWARGEKIEFKFEPGHGFSYSGEGFEYLKRVIEKITGKKINQVFQEELIEPLGLQHFYYQTDPYAIQYKSNGHYDGYPGLIDFPNEPGVAWSLVTNPAAFMEFANAIHQRKGLKPATYEMMFSKQNEYPEAEQENFPEIKTHVGLGWFVEDTPYGRVIKHGGNNGDFRAQFKLYDDLGLAFMLTTNGYTGSFLSNEAEKFLIDVEVMKKIQKEESK